MSGSVGIRDVTLLPGGANVGEYGKDGILFKVSQYYSISITAAALSLVPASCVLILSCLDMNDIL